MARAKRKAPWKRAAPRKAKHTQLTSSEKQTAKRKAQRAGRPYPNLVDNMRVARRKNAGASKRAKSKRAKSQGAKSMGARAKRSGGGRTARRKGTSRRAKS